MTEERVQPSRLEDRAVAEFVHGIDEKCGRHSIKENVADRRPPGPIEERINARSGEDGKHGEIPEGLDPSLHVALGMQRFDRVRRQLGAIPGDRHVAAHPFREILERRLLLKDGVGCGHFFLSTGVELFI